MRQRLLRKAVKNPPVIRSLEEVTTGITRPEGIMTAYKGAGGMPPTGQELKNDFMDTLPSLFREQLFHRFTTVDESFSSFVDHVRSTAQSILFHQGKYSTVNLATEGRQEPVAHEPEGQPNGDYEAEILALNRRFGKGGGKGDRRQGGGGKGGGKGDRPVKCTNCVGPTSMRRAPSPAWQSRTGRAGLVARNTLPKIARRSRST